MSEREIDVSAFNVQELQRRLEELGLPINGNKPVLRERLREAMKQRVPLEEDDDETNKGDNANRDSEEENDEENTYEVRRNRNTYDYKPLLTFKDVEESMEKFSGDDHVSVKGWLDEFEEMAEVCQWADIQKVAYAKRLLTGSAKLFVKYEKCTRTWSSLKRALKDEFEETVDGYQVHRQLAQRKKKQDETYHEYIYKMLDMASQADVDIRSIIQYIIDGIPDDPVNKAVLYGARNIRQLKEKMTQYETMKRSEARMKNKSFGHKEDKTKSYGTEDRKKKAADRDKKVKRCFVCGAKEHLSDECPVKDKGVKCFKCNEHGHIAAKCISGSARANQPRETNSVSQSSRKKYLKEVSINDTQFTALIDTGSDLTLIRVDEYVKLGSPRLIKSNVKFDGIGSTGNETIGEFVTDVTIDEANFNIKFHVVSGTLLKYAILIGTDFLNQVDLNINAGNILISKIVTDSSNNSDVPDIFQITAFEETDKLNVDLSHVKNNNDRREIENMLMNYKPEKTREVGVTMKLVLKDDIPVYSRPRRLSPHEREEVDEIVKGWIEEGIARPSDSEYASPIVLVKKKNGSTRVCIDYRAVNKKIVKDRYPLPLIEDQIDLLQDASIFSTIDLKNGFFHVPIEKDSQKYTSFVTPTGQFEFLKAPFGLCNSPSVFQKFINAVFKDLINKRVVLTYMDDLIVLAISREEAILKLKETLNVASQYGLIINWKKCQLLQEKIEYLGHIVEKGTVRPSDHKTTAVAKFPKPNNVKNIQSFLGLTGYFRKFIPRYSLIARPLTNLLKANVKFTFGQNEVEAFNKLKSVLCSGPVLKLYRPGADTELHTDASQFGYGAILLQLDVDDGKFHPVYFASGKTTTAEEKYTSYELEVLAIIKALKKFRVYLLGIAFTIVTDCQAFQMTMNKKDLCVRVARWALFLEEFRYSIVHRPGRQMSHVDALSRNPLPCVMLLNECDETILTKLKRAQNEDRYIQDLCKALRDGDDPNGYEIKNNLLYKTVNDEPLLVVPKSMQIQVVKRAHDRGHFGIVKTEALVRKDFWFKGMREKVEHIVKNCVDCILAEKKHGKQEGMLNVIDKGSVPLDTYHIDHLGPIPSTKKSYCHILVVVDAFSKFVWLYATRSTDTAAVLDRLQKQSAVFGNPRRIISDRGTAFTSLAFTEYCREEGIQHVKITTGVPRSNGQVERVNRTIIPLLTKLSAPKPEEWYKHLCTVQKYLNATPHRATGRTPFMLLFGTNPRLKNDPQIREIIEEEWIKMFEEQRDEIRRDAKEKIGKVQEENLRTYNKRRKKATRYAENDLVAIRRTQLGPGLKIHSKYVGPYRIIRVLRNDRYVVGKVGEHDGPRQTTTSVDYLKPWAKDYEDVDLTTYNTDSDSECDSEDNE